MVAVAGSSTRFAGDRQRLGQDAEGPMSRMRVAPAVVAGIFLLGTLFPGGAYATTAPASPGSDSIGPSPNDTASWNGPQQDADTAGPDNCDDAEGPNGLPGFTPYCSDFNLSVTQDGAVSITATSDTTAEDIDLYVYDKNGEVVDSSASAGGLEAVTLPCLTTALSPYLVRVVYFTTVDGPGTDPEYTADATWAAAGTACQNVTPPSANFSSKSLSFDPSTVVSPHFLGAEPQTTVEHKVANANNGATSGKRVFIDWPLSSRSNIGQLNRSIDDGDSFRPLIDLKCSLRSRPNCATGGGGDTENAVNFHTGTVMFSDQEVTANEAYAASLDHGDTFLSQSPLTNPSAVDRQWIAVADNNTTVNVPIGGQPTDVPVEGYLSYHAPCVGEYVLPLVRTTGPDAVLPIPNPIPSIVNVGQSGQSRVDNNRSSAGYRWIYQPYNNCVGGVASEDGAPAGSLYVATAYGPNYADPTAWKSSLVSTDSPDIFSWVDIDNAGNAYVVWSTNGVMYLSSAPISDPRNDPTKESDATAGMDLDAVCDPADGEVCGRPGSHWTKQVRVSLPSVGAMAFPTVTAGSPGRIGIAYVGTTTYTGVTDDAPESTAWNVYAAVITNATSATPTVVTGKVSHRAVHTGTICTSGTTCLGDRSLLDTIDLGFDTAGRLGVVYTDNESRAFHELDGDGQDESPFVYFSKQINGPSVLAAKSPIGIPAPIGKCMADPTQDGYWPNVAYSSTAVNLPSMDLQGVCMYAENGNLVVHLTDLSSTKAQMYNDLAAWNAASATNPDVGPCLPADPSCTAERLQFVVRFNTPTQTYHLSMEFNPGSNPNGSDSTRRFFGGLLDDNDKIKNPGNPTGTIGAAYHTDQVFTVTGVVGPHGITMKAPLSQFGLATGNQILSMTAFSMAGPTEAQELLASDVMRDVDATPPLDLKLATGAVAPPGDPVVILTKTAGTTAIVHRGDTINYTLGYTNLGPKPASNSKIVDHLPAQVTFISASNGGVYDASKRTVTWTLGTVPVTGTTQWTVTLNVKVKSSVAPGTPIVNRADFLGDLTYSPPTAVHVSYVAPQ